MPRRNPDATRARILAAAGELFAAAGFAGTRIDAVAARSGANKRMIYHYFGGKEVLFEAVLRHRLGECPWAGTQELDTADARLIAWEGLEAKEPVVAAARAQAFGGLVDDIEARLRMNGRRFDALATKAGDGSGPDAALLALVLVSARLFPLIAPRFAALVTGGHADVEGRYRSLLNALPDTLTSGVPAPKPRVTLRPRVTDSKGWRKP